MPARAQVFHTLAGEAIDPGRFSQDSVDRSVVVQGGLRVEDERRE